MPKVLLLKILIFNKWFTEASRSITLILSLFYISNSLAQNVTGITLSPKNLFLNSGDTIKIEAQISPSNASNQSVHFFTSNDFTAGIVLHNHARSVTIAALYPGIATISGVTDDGGFTDYIFITVTGPVTKPDVTVSGILLNPTQSVIASGDTLQINALVTPFSATMKNVLFSTSNFSIASIISNNTNSSVIIGALFPGIATITAITMEGGFKATAVITVTGQLPPVVVPVQGLNISPSSFEINPGDTLSVNAEVIPTNATIKSLVFLSSENTIAGIISIQNLKRAVVAGITPGITTITAKTVHGGFQAKAIITVKGYNFSLDTSLYKAFPGLVAQYGAIFNNGGNLQISWPSIPGTNYYCIQYATNNTFTTPSVTVCGLTSPNYVINGFPIQNQLRTEAFNDTLYYRIGMITNNGSIIWSDTRKYALNQNVTEIEEGQHGNITIYPVPAQNTINIKGIPEGMEVLVFQSGGVVLEGRTPLINISSLSGGLYFLKVKNSFYKFIKE